METTERIVEAYVRYIKGWATIPNIKCPGQYEIDPFGTDGQKSYTAIILKVQYQFQADLVNSQIGRMIPTAGRSEFMQPSREQRSVISMNINLIIRK